MFPVLVIQKKFVDVIQDIVVNIKQGHQDAHSAIHIKNVHVIRPDALNVIVMARVVVTAVNVAAMGMMLDVENVIHIVHVHVIRPSVHVTDITQDAVNVIHIVNVAVTPQSAVAMDIMQVVDSVIATRVVVVILNAIMIVQQIMVNVL